MTIQRRKAPIIGVADVTGGEARTQVAALCWRQRNGRVEVLLVTSRETGRWVLPKGWPSEGETGSASAEREAWEEAGVRGQVGPLCIGVYAYHKLLGPDSGVPCVVAVYPLLTEELADDFPEAGQRRRKWFSPKKAALRVDEPELREILAAFRADPAGG